MVRYPLTLQCKLVKNTNILIMNLLMPDYMLCACALTQCTFYSIYAFCITVTLAWLKIYSLLDCYNDGGSLDLSLHSIQFTTLEIPAAKLMMIIYQVQNVFAPSFLCMCTAYISFKTRIFYCLKPNTFCVKRYHRNNEEYNMSIDAAFRQHWKTFYMFCYHLCF